MTVLPQPSAADVQGTALLHCHLKHSRVEAYLELSGKLSDQS